MATPAARLVAVPTKPLAPLSVPSRAVELFAQPADAEAVDLANVTMLSTALALGIYIDTFV